MDGQDFGSVILNLAGHLAHASGEEGAAELGTGSGGKWMGVVGFPGLRAARQV